MAKTGERRQQQPPARDGQVLPHSRGLLLAAAGAIVALTLFVFLPVRHFAFVSWDDPLYVADNPHVLAGLAWKSVTWAMTAGGEFYWHPLTWLSHMLDVALYGIEPGAHHVTGLVIHLATSLLLHVTLYRMTGAAGRSAFVAAVFAVHPLHVESVAWIAERKDVLSGFFWVATLAAYTAYVRRGGWARWGLVLACFILGLASKPMVVTLPLVLLLLDYWPLGRLRAGGAISLPASGAAAPPGALRETTSPHASNNQYVGSGFSRIPVFSRIPLLVGEKLPLFVVATLGSVAAIIYQQQAGAVQGLGAFPLPMRLANAVVSYATYLRQFAWPSGLAGFYPYPGSISATSIVTSLLVLLGISAVVWRARQRRYLVVGWLWFLVTLLPVIGIVQVGEQAMADRFMYIPIIGLLLMVAWGVPELLSSLQAPAKAGAHEAIDRTAAKAPSKAGAHEERGFRTWDPPLGGFLSLAAIAIAIAIVLVLAAAARAQVEHWRDSEALWRRAAAVTANNHRAHANLGILYATEGRDEEALAELKEAVRIVPDAADLYNRIGTLHMKAGRVADAREAFAMAVRLWPQYPDAHNNFGTALEREGRVTEAIAEYGEAIRLKADYAAARDNLATALASQGQVDEAIAQEREAIRSEPAFVQARNNLGLILARAGRLAEAIGEYLEALRIEPDYANAHANLADAYGMVGKLDDAAREFREALRFDPRRPAWHFKLAMTLRRLGDGPDADAHLRAALEIDPAFEPARRALSDGPR